MQGNATGADDHCPLGDRGSARAAEMVEQHLFASTQKPSFAAAGIDRRAQCALVDDLAVGSQAFALIIGAASRETPLLGQVPRRIISR